MRAHLAGAERAIQADRERFSVTQRMPECFRRLARQRAAGKIGDRAGNHHRQPRAGFREHFLEREQSRLGVQSVENRLKQENIGAAFDEPTHRFGIGEPQIIETDGAETGIADVRRDRRGAVRRSERAGNETAAAVLRLRERRGFFRQPRTVAIELAHDLFHAVIGLRDRSGRERVRRDDICARLEIGEMNVADSIGLGQD